MEEELVKADVLCVGGGIAGLMAAIRASELGAIRLRIPLPVMLVYKPTGGE